MILSSIVKNDLISNKNIEYISFNILQKINKIKKESQKLSSKIRIIEYIKIIWNIKCPCMEIKQLKNGYHLGYGNNKIFLFDKDFNFKLEISDLNEMIYYISELDSNISDKEINIGVITINNFLTIKINLEEYFHKIENYYSEGTFFLQISQKTYIICQFNSIKLYNDLFDKICQHYLVYLNNEPSFNCLFLNKEKNLIAFTSNEILSKGKNSLIFYDLENNNNYKELSGSFILSSNGMLLFENNNENDKKILLAGCKKYKKYQKNGILISISFFNKKDDTIASRFYETDNFEVYCFCRILLYKNNKNLTKSNYFFVGGFDNDIRQGLIKLYKAYFGENEDNIKIKFIDNIIIEKEEKNDIIIYQKKTKEEILKNKLFTGNKKINEYNQIKIKQNFKGFRGPISSIIQNNISGNILVSCYDGNIYLFTPPNLDFYQSNEFD